MAKKKHKQKKEEDRKQAPKPSTNTLAGFPSYFTNVKLLCLKLFLISVLLYAGTLGHEFTQDDAIVITENEFTTQGIAGVDELLKYDTFRGFFKVDGKEELVAGGRYRPLTPIMFAVGYQMFGDNPFMFHLMNILWYGATVVLVFLVLLRLLQGRSRKDDAYNYFVAFVTALLFAIHPIHTEVVANVKGRDEIMTLFFCLSAMWYSLKAFDEKQSAFQVYALILFFLGMMSKEMAVVFIPIVAMAFFVFRKVDIPKALIQTAPFLGGFAIFMAIRYAVLGFVTGGEPSDELMNNAFLGLDDDQKYGTIFYTLSKYIELLIFPHTLTHDYYPYAIPVTGMAAPRVMLSVLLHLGLITLAAWGVLKRKDIGFGVAFYLVSLILVSNLLVNIGVFMAERFVFMPSLGFCFVVAIGLYHLCKFFNGKKDITAYKQFMPAFIALTVIFLVGCYMTFDRAKDWESNFTLFSADWKKSENSAKIRNAMGGELTVRSQDAGTKGTPKEKDMLMDAIMHLDRAAEIHPTYFSPYFLKGNAFFYLGDFEKSVENYNQSLALKSGAPDTQNNLALAAEQAGIKAGEKGQNDKAIGYFQTAVQYKPEDPKLRFFLGTANAQGGRFQEALKHLKIAEQKNTDPTNFPRIHGALMQVYTSLGDVDNAAIYQGKLGQ